MKLLHKKNTSGFTLLEVIIVVIIIGVLASLALPRFFTMVEYSRAAEALKAFIAIREAMDTCELKHGLANCDHTAWGNLGLNDPGAEAQAHWAYTIAPDVPAAGDYTVTATRNGIDDTSGSAGNTVTMIVNRGANTISRVGTGPYAGI